MISKGLKVQHQELFFTIQTKKKCQTINKPVKVMAHLQSSLGKVTYKYPESSPSAPTISIHGPS